ncbi:MAG: FAD-binding protein [Alphaproteobacteria bacterium]|jgi:glycolate oxidase FAD binding subunit|nr:FAD-binding protein [Alphaproteobacteria bacterium]MDP6566438.1 FAD-binding protein [Alphaproteobacteria bacterium]MDP6811604.1 FAD-binding protein [Alphaproteobacteria bacterium]
MSELLKPGDAAQVLEAVRWAAASEKPLEVLGGGSKRGLGRPNHAGHRLDLTALSGVSLYEPEELVLTASAGTSLGEIQAMLAQQRQQLAFEPPDLADLYGGDGEQTIGGVLAANLAGSRRIKAGAARDHLLGVKGVSGRGEEFKSGGRVVKNVTGYDLCKLMAGSFGTLAAMTEVTVKVLPAPEKTRTVLAFGLADEAAVAALAQAGGSPHEVSGLAHLPAAVAARSAVSYVNGANAAVTAVRIEGPAPSVAHRTGALREQLAAVGAVEELHGSNSAALWREVGAVAGLLPDTGAVIWKVSVPPIDGPAVARRVLAEGGEGYYDWAGGLVWLALPPSDDAGADLVRGAVAAVARGGDGGHATLMRAPEAMRGAVEVFQPPIPALAALQGRIKEAFDPLGILNPGRMYP